MFLSLNTLNVAGMMHWNSPQPFSAHCSSVTDDAFGATGTMASAAASCALTAELPAVEDALRSKVIELLTVGADTQRLQLVN